jgi:hypothetical protein
MRESQLFINYPQPEPLKNLKTLKPPEPYKKSTGKTEGKKRERKNLKP